MPHRTQQHAIGTPREREILDCAAHGLTDKEIAAKLGISRETVATYWKRIRQRLDGASRTEAVARALKIQSESDKESLEFERQELLDEIAARERKLELLRLTAKRFEAVLLSSSTATVLEDADRRIVAINQACMDLLQLPGSPSQYVGKSAITDPAQMGVFFTDPESFLARVDHLVTEGRPVKNDRLILANGRWVSRDYTPIWLDNVLVGHLWRITPGIDSPDQTVIHELENSFGAVCAAACADFVLCPDEMFNIKLDASLEAIGQTIGCDRAFVFLIDRQNETMSNTHEWTERGISREMDNLQRIPLTMFPWSMGMLRQGMSVVVPDVDGLGAEAGMEKDSLQDQGIRSVILCPVGVEDHIVGVIGLDSVRKLRSWSPRMVQFLESVGRAVGGAVIRMQRSA